MTNWAKYWEAHWTASPPPKDPPKGMSRYSIFLALPYWESLKIQHLLDPMHIFKNVAQSTWDHIIGKKDTLGAREDMKSINRLPPSIEPRMGKGGKLVLSKAPWVLSKVDPFKLQWVSCDH